MRSRQCHPKLPVTPPTDGAFGHTTLVSQPQQMSPTQSKCKCNFNENLSYWPNRITLPKQGKVADRWPHRPSYIWMLIHMVAPATSQQRRINLNFSFGLAKAIRRDATQKTVFLHVLRLYRLCSTHSVHQYPTKCPLSVVRWWRPYRWNTHKYGHMFAERWRHVNLPITFGSNVIKTIAPIVRRWSGIASVRWTEARQLHQPLSIGKVELFVCSIYLSKWIWCDVSFLTAIARYPLEIIVPRPQDRYLFREPTIHELDFEWQ